MSAAAQAELNEFVLETGDYKISLKRGQEVQMVTQGAPTPAAALNPAPTPQSGETAAAPVPTEPPPTPPEPSSNLVEVTAPIVGTFYEASAPGEPVFVKVGDRVEAGKVLCIIEAMKLMNEIEAEITGVLKEVLVKNEDPVEYGQALFRIEPD